MKQFTLIFITLTSLLIAVFSIPALYKAREANKYLKNEITLMEAKLQDTRQELYSAQYGFTMCKYLYQKGFEECSK